MDERTALFASALSDPTDDTARLVLADWLEEHDETDRGRFLRASMVASRFRDAAVIDDPDFYAALAALADVTTSGAPARWLSELGIGPRPLTHGDWVWDNAGDRVTVRIGGVSGVFTRGLLSELIAPLSEWSAFAAPAFAAWPLECATITDIPGLRCYIEAPAEGRTDWRLSAALTISTRRQRANLLRRLVEDSARRVGPTRWEAERAFPDRSALAESITGASMALIDELRGAAGALWPPPPRPRG